MYEHKEFPKWVYHRTEKPVIVNDPSEQEALGPEWAETPAAFSEPEQVNVPVTPVPSPEPEDEPEPDKPKKSSKPKKA